ncbi:uncharacterized protein LOC133180589 [Saccostrea echinata]|uniref:uncharacterized protein LOC133180589 n=1 Tax=Saccostrea echinata TaxID=191078 RepID=UPI002A7FF222|nr:uncharacterized protein LOC133180589 [Saccostrea echinata]
MAAKFDCILMHGPPFSGSDVYYQRFLSKDHVRIIPKHIFSLHQEYGLRDIVLNVHKCLKQNQKVVVDDENGSFAKRSAYLRMIQKKLPEKTVALISLLPKYGEAQVLWNQEVCLNEENTVTVSYPEISSWFDPTTGQVVYSSNDEPDEEEGYKVFNKKSHLETFSAFKFDIPGLLIQIEAIYHTSDGSLNLKKGMKQICIHWNEQNPVGRIIFIQYGNKESIEEILHLLTRLAKQLDFPIYLFHIVDPPAAGIFSEPPNPGILAFLQKRHHLFLHSTKTVYIYSNQDHMTMARAAGLNCVKITQILQNPALVIGSHVITRSTVPEYLKTMEILPTDQKTLERPNLPCVTEEENFLNGNMKCVLPYGRQEFIFAKDFKIVLSYQDLYQSCVSVLKQPENIYTQDEEKERECNTSLNTSLNESSRKLPSWMMGKETPPVKKSTHSKTILQRTESSSSTEGQGRQTIYVMTEEELLEIAKDVLKQAGRTDVLRESDESLVNVLSKKTKINQKAETNMSSNSRNSRGKSRKVAVTDTVEELDGDMGGAGRQTASRKSSVLNDLMAETGIRKASPRKTRKRFQLKNEEMESRNQDVIVLPDTTNDRIAPRKVLNFTDEELPQSKSVVLKIGESSGFESIHFRKTDKDLTETKSYMKSGSKGVFPDSQEPGPSHVFTRTHLKSNQHQVKHSNTVHTETVKSRRKRGTEFDDRDSPKLKKTELTNKPDLSILDEIFF